MSLPFRQIHLDFHTSEAIPEVGKHFDPDAFVGTLQESAVNGITLFAKCHHGWSYYPTEIGTPHPHLVRPDLLGEMVEACRRGGISVSIYLTVQWDELTAREHPEWRVIRAKHKPGREEDMDQLSPGWHPLSLANQPLVERIITQACEVIRRYDPAGLFMDILMPYGDVSQAAIDRMRKLELDPASPSDRARNERGYILDYYERFYNAVREVKPSIRIFHNSGHISKNERDRWRRFTHFELESLPTGGWGYDHFPVSAAYAPELGRDFLGMTGKFHTTWGEFGGYKRSVALEYECALMVAMGARCSIGDQLHPSGRIDADTYRSIGPAYRRIEAIESFLEGAVSEAEVAIFSAEGHHHSRQYETSDMGAARMLLELHVPFAVIDAESDFSRFKLIILPDFITVDGELRGRCEKFLQNGGCLILSGSSGMDAEASGFALPFRAKVDGESPFSPDFIAAEPGLDPDLVASPFVAYERSYRVASEGAEVLARIHDPYFNRTWEHFCSHQHAPARPEPHPEACAILRDGGCIYFAHPIFRMYRDIGQPLYKYALRGALRGLLPQPRISVKLPSGGRVNLLRQAGEDRLVLHLLYTPPQLRGHKVKSWSGFSQIEIIEDAVPVFGTNCSIRLDRPPKRIFRAYDGADLPFDYQDEYASFVIDRFTLHEVVVIELDSSGT